MGAQEYFCKALELAELAEEFYGKAASACGDPLGREVFSNLLAGGRGQKELVGRVKGRLEGGEGWDETCTLHELDAIDIAAAFQVLEAEHVTPGTCATEFTAVRTAKDMLSTSIRFYSEWARQAQEIIERRFCESMMEELRYQLVTLADLEYYYEDPEGWALMQDNPVLDGA
jgi:hypothetical protein